VAKIRVFIVDDSALIRRFLTISLGEDPALEVVGFAVNGKLAVPKIQELSPDLVVMDVEMPEMTGVEAVRALRGAGFKAPILMFSTVTSLASEATLDALSAGATGYVNKPNQGQNAEEAVREIREKLIPKIKAAFAAKR
jgi:two-component system, chemotaxis family, protein-glutamate methylesterase/glutaminase